MPVFGPDLETTGTDPFEDEILTVQYRHDGENHVFPRWEYESEQEMIFEFLMEYRDIRWSRRKGGPIRIGYRTTDFDLPFLLARAFQTNVFERLHAGPGFFWQNVIAGPSYLDLSHLLGADMASFEAWREEFLSTSSPSEGQQMNEFYEQGEYEQMLEYIEDELEAMEELYQEVRNTEYFARLMDMRSDIGYTRPLE